MLLSDWYAKWKEKRIQMQPSKRRKQKVMKMGTLMVYRALLT